uniref:Uncharacterized protein n=1 Tax=Cannabis sativa TaxID=3483 RepID=A0A803QGK3_CANSA
MVLTRNKCGLHFTDPKANTGDREDHNEATSHQKYQPGQHTNLDAPIFEDDDVEENSSNDVEDGPQDTSKDDPQDTPKGNHQYKIIGGSIGEKDKPDESDLVIIMAKKL